jgi:HUS1 checkpoint protein
MRFRGVLHAKGVHILTRGQKSLLERSAPRSLRRAALAPENEPLTTPPPPQKQQPTTPPHPKKTAFLPTLEKFGRTAQLLLSPTEVHLVQTSLNTDGPHVTARFDADALFVTEPAGAYRVASRHHDLIAVSLDVALLAKALRSAAAAAAQAGLGGPDGDPGAGVVDVRLTQRAVPVAAAAAGAGAGGGGGDAPPPPARPFLAFGVRGALSQDLPVSRPFAPAEVDRLAGAKDVSELCDYYVDLADCGVRWLQGLCERVRCVAGGAGGEGSVATAASGDLHVSTAAAAGGGGGSLAAQGGRPLLGTLVQGLRVLPAS